MENSTSLTGTVLAFWSRPVVRCSGAIFSYNPYTYIIELIIIIYFFKLFCLMPDIEMSFAWPLEEMWMMFSIHEISHNKLLLDTTDVGSSVTLKPSNANHAQFLRSFWQTQEALPQNCVFLQLGGCPPAWEHCRENSESVLQTHEALELLVQLHMSSTQAWM